MEGHGGYVRSLDFSPDGSRIVTASSDQTARVWDAQRGELLLSLEGHARPLKNVRFSPDGRTVATDSEDHTARIWDAKSGSVIAELRERIGLRRQDGSTLWPVPPEELTRAGCERLLRFEEDYAEAAEVCDPLVNE